MKVILYMAMTVNGYIAKENDETLWSDEEWTSYYNIVKNIGNIVVGRRTYEIMKEDNVFENLGSPVTVVVSNSTQKKLIDDTIFVTSPKEAIKVLKEKGFEEILVGGGSKLNSSFLKEGLIDEIILDVEPLIFGKGIRLFAETDIETKLQLLEMKHLSENVIQLRYKVLK